MKALVKISFLFIACFFTVSVAVAQQTAKQAKKAEAEAALKNKIDNRHFTFEANYALPLRGGQRYLTSEYDLRIVKDSVIAFLPYFGRVYMDPPMNSEDAGIMFTSTRFGYTATQNKKGGWTIIITPSDAKHSTKLQLGISTSGYASLTVTSNNRDQISFDGKIEEK